MMASIVASALTAVTMLACTFGVGFVFTMGVVCALNFAGWKVKK